MLVAAGLMTVACTPREEVPAVEQPDDPAGTPDVSSIDLGTAVGADNQVVDEMEHFLPTDTIYASITTIGAAPNASLTARWLTGDGQVVDETSQTVNLTGRNITTFFLAKPDLLKPGSHKLEVLINGSRVADQSFDIRGNK